MDSSRTLDVLHPPVEARSALARIPRLRLVYHFDLRRVGAVSHSDGAFEAGEWLTVGRRDPLFCRPVTRDLWAPMADPTISRAQFRVRWLSDHTCFEVEPGAEAKRKLRVIPLPSYGPDRPIDAPVRLEPGSVVAIDDRVLIALEAPERARSIEDDRLGMIGESDALWRLRDEILDVAGFGRPALILGETGVGKELVAAAIHAAGPKAGGPFRAVNCAALPEQLVESMLFGHVRGAFSGADSNQEGLFRAAHGGTLFLDELGEMPVTIQPKLLRALQDGVVTAVGRHEGTRVDVRVVAATNRDPATEVDAGRLRSDLYHRLAAHVLQVPTLRARWSDVPSLFTHSLERVLSEHPASVWPQIPLEFFVELMRHDWSGNVRELGNIAEQTARQNLREGGFRRPNLLPVRKVSHEVDSVPDETEEVDPHRPGRTSPPSTLDLRLLGPASQQLGIARKTLAKLLDADALREAANHPNPVQRLQWVATERLHALLTAHDFNQASTAKAMGVSNWTLIRLMQDLGFRRPTELSGPEIRSALDAADGDAQSAARVLRVSEHGLKKRLTELDSSRGDS